MIPREIYDADHDFFREMVERFMEAEVKPFHE